MGTIATTASSDRTIAAMQEMAADLEARSRASKTAADAWEMEARQAEAARAQNNSLENAVRAMEARSAADAWGSRAFSYGQQATSIMQALGWPTNGRTDRKRTTLLAASSVVFHFPLGSRARDRAPQSALIVFPQKRPSDVRTANADAIGSRPTVGGDSPWGQKRASTMPPAPVRSRQLMRGRASVGLAQDPCKFAACGAWSTAHR